MTSADAAALPPTVARVVQRLVASLRPEQILLFGSQAKGNGRSGSDYDLLVVGWFPENRDPWLRRAHQLAADCLSRVDIVLATPGEVAEAPHARSPFLHSILGTARPIYQR